MIFKMFFSYNLVFMNTLWYFEGKQMDFSFLRFRIYLPIQILHKSSNMMQVEGLRILSFSFFIYDLTDSESDDFNR